VKLTRQLCQIDLKASSSTHAASEDSTSELCSDRAVVLSTDVIHTHRSRCSLDLFPLRGKPTNALSRSPPLVWLPYNPQQPKPSRAASRTLISRN